MKYAHEIKDVPTAEHWAVLVNESLTYDDGYGHDATPSLSTKWYMTYIVFDDEEALKAWILKDAESTSQKTYRVLHVKPATVHKRVTIDVDIDE